MGVALDHEAAARLVAVLERLGTERQSLTTIAGIGQGVERHLADSLAALALPEVAGSPAALDIGSGPGFPGLALAAARPEMAVTLVESEGRKADWLRRVSAAFPNVSVVADRSEHLAAREREAWPLVTARALGPPPVALELCAPLVAEGGHVALWRGRAGEEDAIAATAGELGLAPGRTHLTHPFPGAQRGIQLFQRIAPTPARFPRRPGRAAKSPLA